MYIVGMSPYVCDCTNVVYMFCVYCNYVNKFEARSLFSITHLKKIYILFEIDHALLIIKLIFGIEYYIIVTGID